MVARIGGVGGQESHYYNPHRGDELCGPGRRRSSCQLGTAGRQCYRFLKFGDRTKYQKARGAQGHGPQARPSGYSAEVDTSVAVDLQMKALKPAALSLKLKLEEIETQPAGKALVSSFFSMRQNQWNK